MNKPTPRFRARHLPRLGLVLAVSIASGHARIAAQTFMSHGSTAYQAGSVPEDLRLADFNGDGLLDIAVANSDAGGSGSPDTVSVLLNDGDGHFGAQSVFSTGERPEGITTGHFDSGGALDIATANYAGSSITILLGNGSGGFTMSGTIPVTGGPRSVVSGDFTGDGSADLATADYDGGHVSVFRGLGGGTFSPLGTWNVGRGPEVIAAGRLDAGASLDLVTCDTLDDTVSILLGNGSGGFTFLGGIQVGDRPRYVKLADLNGDGLDEILTANSGADTVSVLRNNGGASFVLAQTLAASGMEAPVYLNAGDLDGDGRTDCVVSYAFSDKLAIFPGTGSFSFGPGELISTGENPLGIGIADLDLSGHPDLVVSNAFDNNLYVYLSTVDAGAITLDNGAPGTSSTGLWSPSSTPNQFGPTSLFAKATLGTVYTWNLGLPSAGTYAVYAWWTSTTGRATAAPYSVTHAGGTSTVPVDQTRNGGQWNLLGTYSFASNAIVSVRSTSATVSTSADAVSLLPVASGNIPPSAQIVSIAPSPASLGVPVALQGTGQDPDGSVAGHQWRSSIDGTLSSAASFTTSTLSTGVHTIYYRVQDDGGLWSSEDSRLLEVTSGGAQTIVKDNGDPGTSSTGAWGVSGAPDPYGPSSLFAKNGATYTYSFQLGAAGTYEVYAWWTELSSRPASAPIAIQHTGGTSTVNVDQRTNGGMWNYLGTYSLGSTATVTVTAVGSASTCADAMGLLPAGGSNAIPVASIDSVSPSPATEGETVSFVGSGTDSDGTITAREWRSSIDGPLSTLASFSTSSLSVGTHTIFFRVRDDDDVWSAEVEEALTVDAEGSTQTIVLDNGAPGTSSTGTWLTSGAPAPYGATSLYAKNGATYTYTFSGLAPGLYTVSAWWTSMSSRPASAPIEVVHLGGAGTVNVDQRVGGGQWNVLGSYSFGSTAVVRITAVGSASTCADAISLVSGGSPGSVIVDDGGPGTSRTGTWSASGAAGPYGTGSLYARNSGTYTFTAPAAGTYRVHAWWTQFSSRSMSVPMTIEHASGSSVVTVNQRVNGGQWNLLGTYTFSGLATLRITAVGSDTTCADAVRFEPVP